MLAAELEKIYARHRKKAQFGGRAEAIGLLELLWEWTSKYAIQGDIGKWPNEAIAHGIGWTFPANELISALISSRWVDEVAAPFRLVIHDIQDHATNCWRQNLENAGLTWWDGSPPRKYKLQKSPKKVQEKSNHPPQPEPEPKPEPEPETQNVRAFRRASESAVALPPEFEGFDFAAWFDGRWRKHPIPGRPQVAQQYAAERIFKPAPDGFLPDDFARVHEAWCEYWQTGDSAPCKLEVFIADGWWRKTPPALKARADPRKQASAESLERLDW